MKKKVKKYAEGGLAGLAETTAIALSKAGVSKPKKTKKA